MSESKEDEKLKYGSDSPRSADPKPELAVEPEPKPEPVKHTVVKFPPPPLPHKKNK